MLRQLGQKAVKLGQKICPPSHWEEDYNEDDQSLIVGFQNFFVMTWTALQCFVFLVFLSLFLQSPANEFMFQKTCCTADTLLFDENGVPSSDCAQKSCELYDFLWSGTWSLFDDRPREPYDGEKTKLFEYDSTKWCCNLQNSGDECCDYLPWNYSCGFNMWGCCLAAMCGMLMTQVLMAGFYSIFARRNSPFNWYVLASILGGVLLKITLFMITFYLFFGFVFLFLFFWLFFFWCDNPYAAKWYEFGYLYWYYFLDNVAFLFTEGFTTWDGYWDFDTMVWTHALVAFCIDVVFYLLSICLKKVVKNKDEKKMFDFAFFDL